MTDFHILIPARMNASRLPGKPMADLAGRPLIVRVWERAVLCTSPARVHVVTDSAEIAQVVEAAGGQVLISARPHDSGTSRLAEAAERLQLDPAALVINLQGDEPFMPASCIQQLAELLELHPDADMATLWCALESETQWRDPSVVKLVTDRQDRALYFSRAPIPYARTLEWPGAAARRHLGIYGYRADALARWPSLPPSKLAELEMLEQLQALEAGWVIACAQASEVVPAGVDTAEDLERARRRFVTDANEKWP